MVYAIGIVVAAFVVLVAFAAVTGRIKIKSCCAADPRLDLRMRSAFEDERSPCEGTIDHQASTSQD